jgi:type II secretory pathway predicted ATPase ExeA
MYRKHFGLTRHPFSKELVPEELFVSQAGRELEVRLGHLLELRGIGLFTGEAGSGKTTLCRKVVSGLHTGLYRVFYVPLSTGNAMDLYKSIAWELGLATERSRAALYRVIRAEVTRLCLETKVRPVLVVDEAQHLRPDVLLGGLAREELPSYLAHLLRLAGTELPLFEPAASEALFQATHGLPRKVNLLAHHALLAAALSKAKTTTAEHVQAALPEAT